MREGRYCSYLHDIIAARFRNSIGRLLLTFMDQEKPIVAGLQGTITGEYLGLTLAFDVRFATADTVIVFDNVRTGWPGSPGLTKLMPRHIGISRALSLIQRGAKIDAHEANALGLVSEIVDSHQDLVDRCKKEIIDISGDHPTAVLIILFWPVPLAELPSQSVLSMNRSDASCLSGTYQV